MSNDIPTLSPTSPDESDSFHGLKRRYDELDERNSSTREYGHDGLSAERNDFNHFDGKLNFSDFFNGGGVDYISEDSRQHDMAFANDLHTEPPTKRPREDDDGPYANDSLSHAPDVSAANSEGLSQHVAPTSTVSYDMIDPALGGGPTSDAPIETQDLNLLRRSGRSRKTINYGEQEDSDLRRAGSKAPSPRRTSKGKAPASSYQRPPSPVKTQTPPPAPVATPSSQTTVGTSSTPAPIIEPQLVSPPVAEPQPQAEPASRPPAPSSSFNPYLLYYGTPGQSSAPQMAFPSYYYLPGPMYPAFSGRTTQESDPAYPYQNKPKRLKAHTVTSKVSNIPVVPRDKHGQPMLPLNVGIMTVISLGEVCMREHFHTERYIFPVGYEVTRRYMSTVDPNVESVYHCTILDGGDGPKFQIIANDVPDKPVIAGTATGAWSSIVRQANNIRSRQHSNSVSGPDFFGLGQNTIKHLIQQLPNADKLRDYVWQKFIEGGPLGGRHAAVIPALPEEYETSAPLSALKRHSMHKERQQEQAASGAPKNHYPEHLMPALGQAPSVSQPSAEVQPSPPVPLDPEAQPLANITLADLLTLSGMVASQAESESST